MLLAKLASDIATIAAAFGSLLLAWSSWLALKDKLFPLWKERQREQYAAKWRYLKDSAWLHLPEDVIQQLVRARDSLSKPRVFNVVLFLCNLSLPIVILLGNWVLGDQSHVTRVPHEAAFGFSALLLYAASIFSAGSRHRPILFAVLACFTALASYVCFFYHLNYDHRYAVIGSVIFAWAVSWYFYFGRIQPSVDALKQYHSFVPSSALGWIIIAPLAILAVGSLVDFFTVLFIVSTGWAAFFALLVSPFFGIILGFLLVTTRAAVQTEHLQALMQPTATRLNAALRTIEMIPPKEQERIYLDLSLFSYSIALSFSVSLSAMVLGHQLNPEAFIPQTPRMLFSNAFFDGATVVTSLYVLERAITVRRLFTIPTALLLDLILGMFFACASLQFGVKTVAFKQVLLVLIAHSVDGARWELGPYFWTMHTTFLPLLFYLLVVLVCWAAKAFLSFRVWFYGKAKQLDGHDLTISFLRLTGAVLGLPGLLWQFAAHFKLLH